MPWRASGVRLTRRTRRLSHRPVAAVVVAIAGWDAVESVLKARRTARATRVA